MSVARRPAGAPTGGQFVGTARAEAAADLISGAGQSQKSPDAEPVKKLRDCIGALPGAGRIKVYPSMDGEAAHGDFTMSDGREYNCSVSPTGWSIYLSDSSSSFGREQYTLRINGPERTLDDSVAEMRGQFDEVLRQAVSADVWAEHSSTNIPESQFEVQNNGTGRTARLSMPLDPEDIRSPVVTITRARSSDTFEESIETDEAVPDSLREVVAAGIESTMLSRTGHGIQSVRIEMDRIAARVADEPAFTGQWAEPLPADDEDGDEAF